MIMQTPEQLADWAYNRSGAEHGPLGKEERLMSMLELINKFHYHIIASDIQEACRKRAGLLM